MTYPPYIREKARQLRLEKKLTIDEIAERLGISRTTIYYWVGELEIPRRPGGGNGGWTPETQAKGTAAMQLKYRKLREHAYAEGLGAYPEMLGKPGFRDFLCLYIAEGYKRSRNDVAICNSDEAVMRLAHPWMQSICTNPLRYSIQYHADQDLLEIRQFWGLQLGIEPASIHLQRKSNSNRLAGRSWRSVNGVLNISAGDTYARSRLQAWMDCVRNEWLDSRPSGA